MDETAEYFAEKIEREVSVLETRIREGGRRYLAEVERMAKRKKDPAVADFFRSTARPDRVLARLCAVRALLRRGQIVEADEALEQLRTEGLFVDRHLQHPLLKAGSRVRSGGQRAAIERHGSPADREQKARAIRQAFRLARKAGLSKGDAEREAAKRFRISTRTVRTKVRGK